MQVLVTGGAGYIGSHAAVRLLRDGHGVTIVDNLSRGHGAVIDVLSPLGDMHFHEGDFGDRDAMVSLLGERRIDLVMHFGAKAYVGESMEQPLTYYRNNTAGALALLEAMDESGVKRLVFSSTCATYGIPDAVPITEQEKQAPINPYGRSKLMVEWMLRDYAAMKRARGDDFAYAALRYFNVAGCDRAGLLGEDHRPETHLVPICLEAALGQRAQVTVFGTDYDTADGTCVRDYVHVEDLIDAHIAVAAALNSGDERMYNIGIGRGYSVREVIEVCRAVTGVDFDVVEGERRAGDPDELYANADKIERELGWKASITDLGEIVASAWGWKQSHPTGYESRK